MQTFLPFPDFEATAAVLDMRRLGKQRVECLQILLAYERGRGWANHPATKMWQDNKHGLAAYGVVICEEWQRRGYNDTCLEKIATLMKPDPDDLPGWFGSPDFHMAHRSQLLAKNPDHYRQYFPVTVPGIPYVWPVP